MDGNTHDTPPVMVVPLPADSAVGYVAQGIRRDQAERRFPKTVGPCRLRAVACEPRADEMGEHVPTDRLMLHGSLSEGSGSGSTSCRMASRGKWFATRKHVDTGRIAAKAFQFKPRVVELPEAGDFDTNRPFSYEPGSTLPRRGGRGDPGSDGRCGNCIAAGTCGSRMTAWPRISSVSGRTMRSKWLPVIR